VAEEEHELSADAPGTAGRAPRGLARALIPRGLSRGRKIGIGIGACCLVAVALISVIGSANGSTGKPSPPAAAQSLTLSALGRAGAHVSLNQYRGRALIVNFFASWCVPCKKETPLLAGFYRAHHGQVAIIGVDVNDGTASAEKFTRSAGVAYPIGTDPTGQTATNWGVVAIPQTFFLNPSHHIVKRVFGAVTQADLGSGLARMGSR
jgi:cytochrome c biogenesis protein CcmG/thiol:disulfide interchange protein DsbE